MKTKEAILQVIKDNKQAMKESDPEQESYRECEIENEILEWVLK
jgi:hypothetical protein